MLPSGIIAPADHRTRSAPPGGSLLLQGSTGSITTPGLNPLARGPLAQRAMRLLGIGATGQAYAGWSQQPLERALGRTFAGASLAQPWISARVLPTPQGYVRSPLQGTR